MGGFSNLDTSMTLTPEQLRDRFFQFHVLPLAEAAFAKRKALQCAAFCVSLRPGPSPYLELFDNSAESHVDGQLLYSKGDRVDLESALLSWFGGLPDKVNLPGLRKGQGALSMAVHEGLSHAPAGDLRRAFGAYCRDVPSTDTEAYALVALIHRDGSVDRCGTMLHPELDGLPQRAPEFGASAPTNTAPVDAKHGAAARESILDDLLPTIEKTFKKRPEVQSITLCVAQYFDDGARDAVHGRLYLSQLPELDFDAAVRSHELRVFLEYSPDPINGVDHNDRDAPYPSRWPSNTYAIPAFAAHCREGAHQGMHGGDAYTPTITFRRDGTHDIAPMLRPWLDGVAPAWEG